MKQKLKNKGIKQSISRKGNSMDNGMMETFLDYYFIIKRMIIKR